MVMDAYCDSWKSYLELLKHPTLEGWMFNCSGNWMSTYQAWNVIYFTCLVIMNLLLIPMSKAGLIDGTINAVVSLCISVFWCHLAWFCIVRQNACCGCVGYFLWAFLLLSSFLARFGELHFRQHALNSFPCVSLSCVYAFTYSLLIIPVFYMGLACLQLGCAANGKTRGVALEDSDSSEEASGDESGGDEQAVADRSIQPPTLVTSAAPKDFQAPVTYSAPALAGATYMQAPVYSAASYMTAGPVAYTQFAQAPTGAVYTPSVPVQGAPGSQTNPASFLRTTA